MAKYFNKYLRGGISMEDWKRIKPVEYNAFKEDPNYQEELPGQMAFDDFMLDDNDI